MHITMVFFRSIMCMYSFLLLYGVSLFFLYYPTFIDADNARCIKAHRPILVLFPLLQGFVKS